MEALQAVLSRRSIRKYTQEPVPESSIQKILEAAASSPSAGNSQPWQFLVVTDRSLLQRVPEFHEYAAMLREAPAAILVCGESAAAPFSGAYWVQDCAAASQNILLASHALGLGSCWLGVYPEERRIEGLRELFGIPAGITPFSLIAVGHPAEEKPLSNRFDAQRVHCNRW